MKDGRKIYHGLCEAESLDAAVSRLTRDELAEVAEYLAEMAPKGGLPSQVWGAVAVALNPGGRGKRKHTEVAP